MELDKSTKLELAQLFVTEKAERIKIKRTLTWVE